MKLLPFKMKQDTEIERWRATTWDTKEPETIAWIDSFEGNSVFYDIGANVGIYSLYCAACHPDALIYAFEPHINNYLRLVENIELNHFKNIIPILTAIGDKTGLTSFFIPKWEAGASGGQIENNIDENYKAFKIERKITIPIFTLDDLATNQIHYPKYIKIDIDGKEKEVLGGMGELLKKKATESFLVEVNSDLEDWYGVFMRNGYTTNNAFNNANNHSRFRREKEGIKAVNIVFTRANGNN